MVKALDCEFSLFETFVPHIAFHVGYFAFAVQKATNGNVTAELSAHVAAMNVGYPCLHLQPQVHTHHYTCLYVQHCQLDYT